MRYLHLKTKGVYTVLHDATLEKTMTPVIVYQGSDGRIWVRPTEEFYDGRFERIGEEDDPGPARHPLSD